MHSSLVKLTLALSLTLSSLPSVSAGPHHGVRRVHRRHHARNVGWQRHTVVERGRRGPGDCQDGVDDDESTSADTTDPGSVLIAGSSSSTSCEHGAWQCLGSELQRCNSDDWVSIANCTGDNVVCSAESSAVGCVWSTTPSLAPSASVVSISPSPASSTGAAAATIISSTSTGSATSSIPTSASATPSQDTNTTLPDLSGNTDTNATPSDDNDEEVECDNEEDSETSSYSTPSASASATPSQGITNTTLPVLSGNTDTDANDDADEEEPECDADEESETSSSGRSSASATTTSPASSSIADSASAGITAAPAASPSIIGGNLLAGHGHNSSSDHDWYGAGASSSDDWSESSSDEWEASSTSKASSTDFGKASSTDDWNASSASDSASSTADWNASSTSDSASSTEDWYGGHQSSSASASTIEGKDHSTSASASFTASASKSASSSESTQAFSGSFSAPHYVIYADQWLFKMPSASEIGAYNRFILAFWMTNAGAVDNAQAWEWFDSDTREGVIQEYHDAGIALMVSAFGSTDSPTSNGADPKQTARDLAAWVKKWGMDGVDIDYEDMPAMNTDKAEAWLITFQKELRKQLPAPYIISHAPVAPWFTSAPDYKSGAYVKIHQEVGDGIDFYNVQFYNQGDGVYGDCDSLLHDSGHGWPDTSVMQINSYAGVPLQKIVIGKPLDEGAAANGFIDQSLLAKCVAQAQDLGWNGGVMFWEWTTSAPSLMATVLTRL